MRKAKLNRKTKETDIALELDLDGTGVCSVNTGVGFLDHMLELFACHGAFDVTLRCVGDTKVDDHHSVEDIAIVLGKAIAQALGDKKGIERYAVSFVPMDESLARVVIDVSGRPYLAYNAPMAGSIGTYDAQLNEEFFRALTFNAGLTVHIDILAGSNKHHMTEAIFKAFARALRAAIRVTGTAIPSSKGVLE